MTEVTLAHILADVPTDDRAEEIGQDSWGGSGGKRATVPATARRRAPVSHRPKRGHLHSDSSFFTSTGLGGRGSDLLVLGQA